LQAPQPAPGKRVGAGGRNFQSPVVLALPFDNHGTTRSGKYSDRTPVERYPGHRDVSAKPEWKCPTLLSPAGIPSAVPGSGGCQKSPEPGLQETETHRQIGDTSFLLPGCHECHRECPSPDDQARGPD